MRVSRSTATDVTVKAALLGLALPAAALVAFVLVWRLGTPMRASVVLRSRQEVVHAERLRVGDVQDDSGRR